MADVEAEPLGGDGGGRRVFGIWMDGSSQCWRTTGRMGGERRDEGSKGDGVEW